MNTACLLAALMLAATVIATSAAHDVCQEMFGAKGKREKTTVVFVADNGTYSGTDEAIYIKANLVNTKTWNTFDMSCTGGAMTGTLMGQKVIVITAGIGPMQAAVCTQFVMLTCPKYYKEALYMGTSGWPAALGGVLNPPSCNATNGNRARGQVTRIGDICIPAFAVNWDCRSADWEQQAAGFPNICSAPSLNLGPTADFLYGKCLYTSPPIKSIKLSRELAQAARSQSMIDSMPPRLDRVKPYETEYWRQMIEGTGDDYYVYPSNDTTVNVWDYTQCAEIDSQFFFSGVPWEWEARSFVATTLNQGFNTDTYRADNVMYANAMEGIGFSQAMEDYTRMQPRKPIPYAMIRAASNWSHKPIKKVSEGVWESGSLAPDHVNGYAQAIQSYSNAFLTMMKLRCLELYKVDPSLCVFEVVYQG